MKYILYAIVALTFAGVIFVFAKPARASSDHIVINEIYPNPNSGENEWVEIYNPTNSAIDISSFSLKKSSSNVAKNFTISDCVSSDDIYYVCNLGSSWLVNNGATITLFQNSLEIDNVTYESFDNFKGKSLARIPNGSDTGDDQKDFRVLVPTMGTENFLPLYSNQVYVNEILPQPATTSADEFIELYNSGSVDIDLSNWQIDDVADGGSSAYTIPAGTIIFAGNYITFYNSIDHISFNDSGDWARLIDPNGDEKSAINYPSSNRGQSYSKFGDNWQWTTTITPNAANILTVEIAVPDEDLPILQTDIAGARNQPDGTVVSVTGIVSVVPGKLSSQYFYIQDSISGIQIYFSAKNFPSLSAGDEIRVIGEMATVSGERRIKISQASDIQIISTHPPPEADKTTISAIGENLEGRYIKVIGTVTKTSGDTFYIHGSGEIQVSIRSGVGIKKPKMKVGDIVEVAGILSQYGETYRLLPIVQSDVKIIKSSGLAKTGPEGIIPIIFSLIISWITLVILQRKQKI